MRRQDAGHFSAADKREATALLADALHGILDTVFTRLIDDIDRSYGKPGPHSRAIKAAEHTINDVKYKGTSDQFIRGFAIALFRLDQGAPTQAY